MFVALLIVIVVLMTTNILNAFITAAVFGGLILLLTIRDGDGRSVLSRTANRVGWTSTKRRKANIYRSGPLGRADWGTNQLPGLGAQTQLSEHEDSYARPFAMTYSPHAKTYSIVIGTEPDGAALVDQEQVDLWVADWGHWLRNLGDEPNMEAAAVTIETAPDSGRRLRREGEANTDPDGSDFAKAMLGEVVLSYPAGSSTVKSYVGQGIISALTSAESNQAVTTAVSAMFGANRVEDNCYAQDGHCQAGNALDDAAHNSYTGGAAQLGGYRLGQRLVDYSRNTQGDGGDVETTKYTVAAPASGELPNIAFITPSNADDYAAEIEQLTQILEDELQ